MREKKRVPTVASVAGLLGAGVLLLSLAGCDSAYAHRAVTGAVLPVPTQDAVDLLIVNWDVMEDVRTIYVTYLAQEGNSRRVRWEKGLEEYEGWNNTIAAFDESRVYCVAGTRLLALERADGATAWEVPLSDLVSISCQNCFQKVKGYLVVLTTDYVLHGIDVGSGDLAWSIRLNNAATAYEGFTVVDGQVVLVDRVAPDGSRRAVHVFDPAGGRLVRRVAPTCPEDDDLWFNEVFVDASSGGRAIFLYDCSPDSYAQSWSLASGEMVWQQALPREASASVDSFVFGRDALYLASSYRGLVKIDLASGQSAALGEPDPDYDLTLLEEHEGLILAQARRTRGSTRHELWGLNPAGEPIWRYEMEADTLYGVAPGLGNGAYRFTPSGLVLIQPLEGREKRLSAVTLQPQTGQVVRRSELAVAVASLQGVAWGEGDAYVTVWGDVYAVDLETLDIRKEWP